MVRTLSQALIDGEVMARKMIWVEKQLYSFQTIKLLPSGTGASFLSSSLDSIIRVVRAFLRRVDNQLERSKLRVEKRRMRNDIMNKKASVQSKSVIHSPCFPFWAPASAIELLLAVVSVELVAVSFTAYSPARSLAIAARILGQYVYGHICAKTPPSEIISLPTSATGIRIVEKRRKLLIVIPVAGDLLLMQVGSLLRQHLFILFQQPGL